MQAGSAALASAVPGEGREGPGAPGNYCSSQLPMVEGKKEYSSGGTEKATSFIILEALLILSCIRTSSRTWSE